MYLFFALAVAKSDLVSIILLTQSVLYQDFLHSAAWWSSTQHLKLQREGVAYTLTSQMGSVARRSKGGDFPNAAARERKREPRTAGA